MIQIFLYNTEQGAGHWEHCKADLDEHFQL